MKKIPRQEYTPEFKEQAVKHAQAVDGIFRRLSHRVGFEITSAQLRHSYAIYLLWRLRRAGFDGDPLLYVADRLGVALGEADVFSDIVNGIEKTLRSWKALTD